MTTRALYYEPIDGRPDTALAWFAWVSGPSIAGGFGFMVGVPLITALFFLIGIGASLGADAITDSQEDDDEELILEEEDVIEARFVRLGIDFEDELPNRVVPVQSTVTPQPTSVPTEDTPQQAEEREEVEEDLPPDTIEDLLTRIDERAELFEEIAERQVVEGDPDGLEEGTETTATEGDLYRGRLYSFFRRGWTVPVTIPDDVRRELLATVRVQIGQNLEIVSFRIVSESGNALFDDSITQQLTRLQAADQHIPPPPEEVADQYIGQSVGVRFSGRQAGR